MSERVDAWQTLKLSDVTEKVNSWDPSSEPEFTYVDISSIDNERCEIADPKRLAGAAAPSRARRPVEPGDVLFSNVRTNLRNVAEVRDLDPPAVASTGFTVLRPTERVRSRYLYHLVRSDYFIGRVTPEQTGTHYPATSDRVVRDQEIPVPPLSVQDEIASTLDLCFASHLTTASRLQQAETAMRRFREAVLAAACSGRLTSADDIDSDTEERSDGLPALPNNWRYERLDTLRDPEAPIVYGIVLPGPQVAEGVPYVRQQDVLDGTVRVDDLGRTAPEIAAKHARSELRPGDVLLCIIRNLRVAIVPDGLDGANITQGMVRVRPGPAVLGPYLASYLESPHAQRWMKDRYIGLAMPRINVADARSIPVAVPPLDEQARIIGRMGELFVAAESVVGAIAKTRPLLDRAHQSILRRTFSDRASASPAGHGLAGISARTISAAPQRG